MERKPLYQFSEWFVACLGNLVRDAYTQAEMLGVEKQEARKAIKLAFEMLGKRHQIKISGLNSQLGKNDVSYLGLPEDIDTPEKPF